MTRVAVISQTPMVRAGLRGMLQSWESAQVVSEAASLADLQEEPVQFDVLLMGDDSLPEQELRLLSADGAVGVVVLSADERPAALLSALPLRGWGIVPADVSAPELAAAVEAVGQGLVVVPPTVARRVLLQSSPVQSIGAEPLEEPLTPRELEVLELLSEGLSNKLIARQLSISEHTVKFHVSSLYTKLGAASRTDAVNRGARRGLITF